MPPIPKPARANTNAARSQDARLTRLESELARLSKQVALLDAALRLRDPILLRHGATDTALLAGRARVDAQDHLDPDSGFHPLEYALDGTAVRWTGPGQQSRLTVFVGRTVPVAVALGVHDFGGIAPDSLLISVDGDSQPLRRQKDVQWTAGPWPSRSVGIPTEIAILVPATSPRRNVDGLQIAVGIALTHIEIGPA